MRILVLLSCCLLPAVPALAQSLAVTQLNPARNAVAVVRSGSLSVTLSQTLTASSAAALKVFSNQRGGRLSGMTTVNGNTLSFSPARAFRPGETVRATLTTAAQSATGAILSTPQVWQFTADVQGGTGQFGGGSEVTVGTKPSSLATGDVDGDGDLDMLVANSGEHTAPGNTVSIRLNNGQGTFASPAAGAEVTLGAFVRHVTLGDVDADGDLDLLAANYFGNTVSVRLNNGSGVFAAPASGGEVAVNVPIHVALMDVDADGDLDMAAVNGIFSAAANGSVSIRLNNGNGQFTAPAANTPVMVGNGPDRLATGDIDNDGDLDLLVPNDGNSSLSTVSIRLNDGRGVYAGPAVQPEIPMPVGTAQAMVGDVDADGDLDLLAVHFGGPTSVGNSVSLALNDGSGEYAPPSSILVGDGPIGFATGDVDADGDLDLLVANYGSVRRGTVGNTLSLRLNSGLNTGTFVAPAIGSDITVGTGPCALALADVDNDGDLDVLCANRESNTVSVRLNNGTGSPLASKDFQPTKTLMLYPNPAHEEVEVKVPVGTLEVLVFDALGRCVHRSGVGAGNDGVTLKLLSLAPGCYVVRAGAAAARLLLR